MSLTESKQRDAIKRLNAIAQKVFDATPISEFWSVGQVASELRRRGHNVDGRTVQGCLEAAVDAGLARREAGQNRGKSQRYRRVEVRPDPPSLPPIDLDRLVQPKNQTLAQVIRQPRTEPMPSPKTAAPLLDRMASIAASLRRHAKDSEALAAEIEDAALAAQQQVEAASADGAKLRQLQSLMRDVLGGAP